METENPGQVTKPITRKIPLPPEGEYQERNWPSISQILACVVLFATIVGALWGVVTETTQRRPEPTAEVRRSELVELGERIEALEVQMKALRLEQEKP